MKTKNITVSVDEETHRRARIRAAELDTSVSALVREYLRNLARGKSDSTAGNGTEVQDLAADVELRPRNLDEILAEFAERGVGLRMSDNLSREELYDRDRARAEAQTERRRGSSS